MNAINLEPITEPLLSNTITASLAPLSDEAAGWKTEAQRLAMGAKRRARELQK